MQNYGVYIVVKKVVESLSCLNGQHNSNSAERERRLSFPPPFSAYKDRQSGRKRGRRKEEEEDAFSHFSRTLEERGGKKFCMMLRK